jgi:DNA-binding NarL/FixJ family response regulator
VLVVERDATYREWLRLHLGVICPEATVRTLTPEEFEPWTANTAGHDCDVLLLAASFGSSPEDLQAEGLPLLRLLRAQHVTAAVIALAEDGNELTAVRALQLGAADYLPKRLLTPERLKTAMRLALRRMEQRVERRLAQLAEAAPTPCGARAEEPPSGGLEDRPPAIAGYTITRKIGESDKALVYLAVSATLGFDVALKIAKTSHEGGIPQGLEREYSAIIAIRDPAVVRLYDYGIQDGLEYLAMEYFPRGDLKMRMYYGVSELESLRYLEQIASALRVVHSAGLLHRDLKPPNVMLRENGDIALIDFGLARPLDGTQQSTRTGVLRGSPYYMSPEQALGEPLDGRSDLYSLGVIFYEMLTGRKPFTGGSAMEVLQQHVNAPPPRLPLSLSRYTPVLGRMLAKKREQRFGCADEVIEAVATLIERVSRKTQPTAA